MPSNACALAAQASHGAGVSLGRAWINEATAEMAQVRQRLGDLQSEATEVMGRETLVEIVNDMSLVVSRLGNADPEKEAALYRELRLRLTYSHAGGRWRRRSAPPKRVRNVVSEGRLGT